MGDYNFGDGLVNARRHSNGGGCVATSARVASTVFVGPDARVYGRAICKGACRIEDCATVFDDAIISGNATVSGGAKVFGCAEVGENAKVFDRAEVSGLAIVVGNVKVFDSGAVNLDEEYSGDMSICSA